MWTPKPGDTRGRGQDSAPTGPAPCSPEADTAQTPWAGGLIPRSGPAAWSSKQGCAHPTPRRASGHGGQAGKATLCQEGGWQGQGRAVLCCMGSSRSEWMEPSGLAHSSGSRASQQGGAVHWRLKDSCSSWGEGRGGATEVGAGQGADELMGPRPSARLVCHPVIPSQGHLREAQTPALEQPGKELSPAECSCRLALGGPPRRTWCQQQAGHCTCPC